MCYNNGYRDAATVNSLRLLDSYKNFTVVTSAQTILKLDAKEAAILRPYFDDVLKRAMTTYAQKYKMTLPGPVQVEVYPNHDDFAVRTVRHAGSRRARRHLRHRRRHGQPVGPQARLVQLGRHAVARDEPRLRAHGHEPSRAALVCGRPGGSRRRPGQSRRGPTVSRRTSSSRSRTRSCCRCRSSIAASSIPNIPSRSWCPTSRRAASATTFRSAGEPTSSSTWCTRSPS